MTGSKPPAGAQWLLRHSGLLERNAPLLGDLLEEFQNGRSAAWFWRQTLAAIVICWMRDLRVLHRYWRAVVAGWAAQVCVAVVLWHFHVPARALAIGIGLGLCVFQFRAEAWLAGSRSEWEKIRWTFRDHETGPWWYFAGRPVSEEQTFYWGRIPLAGLVACDEFLDHLVTYLFLVSCWAPNLPTLLCVEMMWLLSHEPARLLARLVVKGLGLRYE